MRGLTDMLRLAGTDVRGTSTAGVETCIELPGQRLAFDMGICPRSAISADTVLVSHTHMDHVSAIGGHASTRELLGMKPPTYVVPRENLAGLRSLFAAYREL